MFKQILYRLLVFLLLGFSVLAEVHAQDLVLRSSVLSAGGQQSTDGTFVLQSTLGQLATERTASSGFLIEGGFWPQVANAAGPLALPAAANDTATTDEDTATEIDVLANDSNPSGGALTIVNVGSPEHGQVAQSSASTFTYTPEADFFGEDRFSYIIQNENGGQAQATVTITINSVNDAPVFTSTPGVGVAVEAEYSYAVETTDVDEDALAISAPTLPSWLALTDNGDGTATLTGTPTASQAGDHAIILAVNDGNAAAEQSFTITVTAVAPGVSTLLLPEDGMVVDPASGVLLAWRAVPGAASYNLELATVEDFSSFESSIVGITDTTWTLFALNDNITYFWRIRAVNSIGQSDFTVPFRFSTGVNVATEDEAGVPTEFALQQNYPNPFNPTTTIAYALAQTAEVRLVVYDLFGRAVKTLVHTQQAAGRYDVPFDADNLASGTYFYRIEAGSFSQTRKLILLK